MKFLTLAFAILTFTEVEAAAPSPTDDEAGAPARPAAARLDEARCQAVWKAAEKEGDLLSAEGAKSYIEDFAVVDTNKDGKISEAEFTEGCSGGWVLAPEESEKMEGEQSE